MSGATRYFSSLAGRDRTDCARPGKLAMNPTKVNRSSVAVLTDLPNIGKASAEDLRLIGIYEPGQLVGKCPFEMYDKLCEKTAMHHDPCVIDVFMSVVRFMDGEEPRSWWTYTEERKRLLRQRSRNL